MKVGFDTWAAWLVAVAIGLALGACEGCDGAPAMARPGDRELLVGLGERVVVPTYRELLRETDALRDACGAYADAPSPAAREGAQEAWRRAMAVWQRAEVMQIGPAGPAGDAVGGAGLRDEIYPWPTLATCVVDQRTVGDDHDDPDALAANPVNERGLGAVEYLLFVEGTDNTCSPLSGINTDGSWAALGPAELEQQRARLAHSLATIVHRRAGELVAAWEPDGGDFLGELRRAGEAGAVYGSVRDGLHAVTDAMFYLDLWTKDRKLAIPAGLSLDCPDETCPDRVESRWAGRSKEHLLENLRAFELLFLGAPPGEEGRGFDDLLEELGEAELAAEMASTIADAQLAVEAIDGTLREAVTADVATVRAAYDAVKRITDLMKMRFHPAVMLALPAAGAGDTD